jgi:hypothetical protein
VESIAEFESPKTSDQDQGTRQEELHFLTFVRVKMMIAKTLGITPFHLGINQTLPDHLLGHIFVIRPLLLLAFAAHADGLMVINR